MSTGNNIPLYKKTHWRRLKEFVSTVAEYEKINIDNYDLSKITCYETIGDGLKGKNVTYSTDGNNSCWVSDNQYAVYEIPSKSNFNKYPFTGNFLCAVCNNSFDNDWIICTMSENINYQETKKNNYIVENVHFTPYGKYTVVYGDKPGDCQITKVKKGNKLDYGAHVYGEERFDAWGIRKKAYTKKTSNQILAEIIGGNKDKKVISDKAVKKNKNKK